MLLKCILLKMLMFESVCCTILAAIEWNLTLFMDYATVLTSSNIQLMPQYSNDKCYHLNGFSINLLKCKVHSVGLAKEK